MKSKNCVFCKIVNKKTNIKFVYENDSFLAFRDANPFVEGHTLIIPKKHFINSIDLPSKFGSKLFDAIKKVSKSLLMENGVEGFNIIQNNFPTAGQIVMHAHFHIIPRRKGDGVKVMY